MNENNLKKLVAQGLSAMQAGSDIAAKATDEISNDARHPALRSALEDPPLVGRFCCELAIKDVVGNDRPHAVVLEQATMSRARLQTVKAHQPFDAMQAA